MNQATHTMAAACVALAVGASSAAAQEWRTVDVSRQLRDSGQHQLRIDYGAGHLDVRSTPDPVLFKMRLRYNDANGTPMHQYSADERTLRVGMSGQSLRVGKRMSDETSGEMHLALSRVVPFDLQLEVGAAKADVELGLMLTDAKIHAGASDMTLGFSMPNVARMRALDIEVGAASLVAKGLANANTPTVKVEGGVGDITLAFDGAWTQNMALDATVAIGKLTVRVPDEVGIRVDVKRVLAGFDHAGLVQRADGSYYSGNYDSARFKLQVHAETVLGAIEVGRTVK